METLRQIQAELKAPKSQFNSFGKYNYRSCEDILEAVKPLLEKHGAILTITDTIEPIGGWVYVKATAKFENVGGYNQEVSAYAREAETKKGMDVAQITGAASSYARKYALGGLFLLDDTKDPDTRQAVEEDKNKSYPNMAVHESNGAEIKREIENALTPEKIGDILVNRTYWIKEMPKLWRDRLYELADKRREALGTGGGDE